MKLSSFVDAHPITLRKISTNDNVDVSNFAKLKYVCFDYEAICSIKRFWFICELVCTIIKQLIHNSQNMFTNNYKQLDMEMYGNKIILKKL